MGKILEYVFSYRRNYVKCIWPNIINSINDHFLPSVESNFLCFNLSPTQIPQDISIPGALYPGSAFHLHHLQDQNMGERVVLGPYQHGIDTRTTKTRYVTQEKLRALLQI